MFSSDVEEGKAKGNLGLKDGFLLTVGGEAVGWKVCDGELGQRVVSFLALSSVFRGRMLTVWSAGCLEGRRRKLHRHVCAGCAGCAVLISGLPTLDEPSVEKSVRLLPGRNDQERIMIHGVQEEHAGGEKIDVTVSHYIHTKP